MPTSVKILDDLMKVMTQPQIWLLLDGLAANNLVSSKLMCV